MLILCAEIRKWRNPILGIFQLYQRLTECVDESRILKDVSMKEHTSFKVGGNARYLVLPETIGEIVFTVSVCKEHNIKYYIMGKGSNLIVTDDGYDGVIIKLGEYFNEVTVGENTIYAQSGALMSIVAAKALQNTLEGLEFGSGIPGTVGGAVAMNAGAYGGEMSQITESVKVMDEKGIVQRLNKKQLNFGYRQSIFQNAQYLILEVEMKLNKGQYENIRSAMKEMTEKRMQKQPLNYPSAGSVFKRPEGHYAGKLIEDAGLKGLSVGGARVSPLHAGFIINEGNATSQDIINLIAIVKNTVYEKFGIMLKEEVKILG